VRLEILNAHAIAEGHEKPDMPLLDLFEYLMDPIFDTLLQTFVMHAQ
jgi:hypothetical protein